MQPDRPSRLETTRQQLRIARSAIIAASVAAFGGIVVTAKASHPATHTSRTSVTSSEDDSYGDDLDYGDGSISPSIGSTPSFRSGSS